MHDGSAILIKQNIKHKVTDDFDTDILQITIETNTGPINIATTYLPPRRPYLPITDFHRIASQNYPTYIIGDLNAHHPQIDNKKENTVGKALMMLININKLTHIGPDFPTFISHNSRSTPDIILTNNKTYHNIDIQTGPTTSSDHLPIIIKITAKPVKIETSPTYSLKKTNWEEFKITTQHKTRNINVDPYMDQQTLENSLKEWTTAITSTMEEHIPITKHKTVQKSLVTPKTKELQWWAQQLIENSMIAGWTYTKYITYKTIRQAIVTECKQQSNKNWENKIKKLNHLHKNPQKFWQNIKQLKGNKTRQTPYLIHENTKIYEENQKETIFREIWSNVFKISPEENLTFDQENDQTVNEYINNNRILTLPYQHADPANLNINNEYISPITLQDIKNTIKQLKNNTPGHTKINKTILANLPNEVLDIYTKLLNVSLSMGYFPKTFKHAQIKLIPKPDKPTTDPNNFRPISLLEVPSKIYEKIINTRLRTFLESNNILPSTQHGFRKNRSTDTALATITETISKAIADKKQCCVVLRDVSKAFDKVWLNGLKYKILQIQTPTILAKLLNSFLDNRTASISLKNYDGPRFQLHSGVPQGSSLSPTLYTIYTYDIPPPLTNGINIQYADDITQIIIQPGKSRHMLARKIEREIKHISNYENKWKIKTNTSKFTLLPIAIKKTTPVTIDGENIPYANKASILGLKIGTQGYTKHISNISKKATLALKITKRFDKLDSNIKLHLIKACVLPILTYPTYTLSAISNSQMLSLQRIQNKALRFTYNEKYPYTKTTEELHSQANLLPINLTLHKRGNQIKHKLEEILDDTHYKNATTDHEQTRDHNWFKRPITYLNKINPLPIYTAYT